LWLPDAIPDHDGKWKMQNEEFSDNSSRESHSWRSPIFVIGPKFSVINMAFFHNILKVVKTP